MPPTWAQTADAVVAGARQVARVVVPVSCPGCDECDVPWCDSCAAPWWAEPCRVESDAGRLDVAGRVTLPVWSIAELTGPVHGMVAAWKDSQRRDLDGFFADAMARAARHVAPGLADLGVPLAVVPVPARTPSTRRRGIDLPALLARAAAEGLRRSGMQARDERCLAVVGRTSRHSSARARWRGARTGLRVKRAPSRGRAVVLVDDVVTTGATLAACVSALEAVHAPVVTSLTLASTPSSFTGTPRGLG